MYGHLVTSVQKKRKKDVKCQTRGFKTVIHKLMGDVTVAPSTIYYAVYGSHSYRKWFKVCTFGHLLILY